MFLHLVLVLTLGAPESQRRELASAPERELGAREASAPIARPRNWTLDQILEALRIVETGGEKDGGRQSTGDGGGAIGPYQIHRAYWIDARIPGRWEDCREPRYARKVVIAYWTRYCKKALEACDAETLARIHNGGPDGAREKTTLKFWRKIERELVRQHEAREKKRTAIEAGAKQGGGRPSTGSTPTDGRTRSKPGERAPKKPAKPPPRSA